MAFSDLTKKAEDMNDEHATLDQMQLLREECIEKHGKEQSGDDKQSTMPAMELIPGVIEDEKALDLSAGHITCKRNAYLPAKDTKLAWS